jgi:diguanylate cyclase (GGDEF)-like protein/PAS domain S-box-containing protein
MKINRRLWFGFIAIILIVIGLGGYSLSQLNKISKNMDDLYQHPFTISNATQSMNFQLVSMHRFMKDVVLSTNENELSKAIALVEFHEAEVLKDFDIIFDRFLGDKYQINKTYKTFLDWRPIRNEVIQLTKNKQLDDAIKITKGKGAKHVEKLNLLVKELNIFALHKAKEFHQSSMDSEKKSFTVMLAITFTTISLIILFAIYIVITLNKAMNDRLYRNHLIDQNIMLATLDENGVVKSISNALCRFLGQSKGDLIGKPSHFFDNSDDSEELEDKVLALMATGAEWKGEIKHYDKDGNLSWANSTILPSYDSSYKIIEFTNILVSITNKKLSMIDKLTTLLNRRRYDESIIHEMRLAKRNNHNLSLAILDIDFFKKYNDHYGHPQGDLALKKVSEVLLSSIKRAGDYAFRIGGEEFALLFSNLTPAETKQHLLSIKEKIEDLKLMHEKNEVSQYLTISIGAHTISPTTEITHEQLYIEADKALYLAKSKRNTVVVTE